ncbi:Microtubule-actin cross-linking factor 1, isoforms 1/2/3/5 [Bagarius yarrelli]|uniref:Microtubule-actin cross-linking factor 1, isoforms 1/2/3/5 n=1 Tax=Bagarius yarrelli TaxID=175774 RepID=A0A556TPL4_BAGYA|nr:Microtubule-actin cross-linking factor 1, isoforms 1/2/3/5 [Bagarius yarrelli]
MSSSDEESLSERSCVSERSFRSERSGGSLSPCPQSSSGPKGDTLPWNLSKHERRKRKSQDSVLDPAERAVVRVAAWIPDTMAGFIPGLLPTTRSQEKEFAKAYEDVLERYKDERDRVQKKTFTKWVNKHLIKVRKHITDLYEDLRDGHNLISLLEVLSGVTLPREKGRMRFHRLQNVQIALDFLKQRQVKLVNIRNDDITDGNPKLTLGLIWTIILHFQQPRETGSGSTPLSPRRKLRFRRKRKVKNAQKGFEAVTETKDDVGMVSRTGKAFASATDDGSNNAGSNSAVIETPTQVVLVPGVAPILGSTGTLRGSKVAILSPAPSPAWMGTFPQVSAAEVTEKSQSKTNLGSMTPGGGRVCRVQGRVQGILERPCILSAKSGELKPEDQGRPCKLFVDDNTSEMDKKGIVHIREVDGRLCVVRTVYPRNYGSPSWHNQGLKVHQEPLVASPIFSGIQKVQLEGEQQPASDPGISNSTAAIGQPEKEFLLDSHTQVVEGYGPLQDPQSSGYASDVPITSPDMAATALTDWGSSSEVLNTSVLESPIFLPEKASQTLSQISEIYVSGESGDLTAKEKLLLWTQKATEGFPGIRCVNFSSSWSDGRLFNALLHRYRPDLIDMELVAHQSNRENLEQAFEIAESLGVTRLLDAEDVDVTSPDEKSVITYVSSIYDAFPKIPEGGEGITPHEVDQRWTEYQSRFSSLLQWTRQHTALMASKSFPQNPVELKALYNEYIHFKETEIPAKENEKGHIEHLYKLLEVWIEFGRLKLAQGLHPNDLEEQWGKLILEMLEREKALRPAVERLELLLQMANKIQNMAVDCEEKLTLAKNTLQSDMSQLERGEQALCEQELGAYLQDCEALIRQMQLDLQILRDEKYYQVEQLAFRITRLQEELVSLRLQCSSVYRKGHFLSGGMTGEQTQRLSLGSLATLGAHTLLGAAGVMGNLLRRPMSRSELVSMSSSEDEGSLRFIYELLGWVEATQELLEQADWGTDLPSVDQHLQDHHTIHTAVEELLQSLKEAQTLAKLENQYCKLLENSSWRLRCLESLRTFVVQCTEELIWLNEKEEEELAFDWSENNNNMAAKREQYTELRSEMEEKQEVMCSLQETADQLCRENHPAKQTVEEEKEQLIKYRSSVAGLVGRAKTVIQLRPRNPDYVVGTTTPIRGICDYKQIECVLEDNSQRTKWKIISPTGNEAMVPSVCFTVPPPNQEAIDTASRTEQLYQNVMSLWHQQHMNMKSVVSWHYLQKDISIISSWTLDTMRFQSPSDRQQALDHLDTHLADFLADSRESALFTAAERHELEQEAKNCHEHCQALLISMETVEKDESVSRSYLSELQSIKSHLQEAEQKLMMGMQTPPPSVVSGESAGTAVHIAEQEKLQQQLKNLQSDLGDVSRRCVSFFEEKPSSSSVPVLRSELNLAVEKVEQLNSLSSVYLHKLKTVDVLLRSLQAAESQVKKYEGRLSEEDIVPADTTAIQALRGQINKWNSEMKEQDHIFQSLSSEVQQAREAGTRLNQLHAERSPELERYQEKAQQLTERWKGVHRQMETRQADLETIGSVLQQYRHGHSSLIRWIEETTEKQENTQPEQTDSKALSEQLAQQTALVAEIEQNQVKLDECQMYSKHYCTAVKDYELQLMTYRAFVESTQKSPVKRRRMHSSSDAITQEFMDLRTRYTALVTLTTQHVKYISDALRRLEEEEKQVEEERQACVGQVSDLLGWVKGHQERAAGPAETSLAAQQAISEQLASKREEVAEAIRSTEGFLRSKQASKLSPEERAQVTAQLDELKSTYGQLCDRSAAQLQHLEEQLAKEEKRKGCRTIAGVIDLGTVETFPIFQSAQRGLIDQDTCHVLLEAQLVSGGLLHPDSPQGLSLEKSFNSGLIDSRIFQSLSEIEAALNLVQKSHFTESHMIPVAAAMEVGYITEQIGLRVLELQVSTGGFWNDSNNEILSLENAKDRGLISAAVYDKLCSRLGRQELIDPNTAEKLSLSEFYQRCILNQETGLRLLPVNQQSRGTICLRSGIKVGIFRAAREGLIDRQVTIRLLEAQLFAGGIPDPRTGHRLTIDEAVRHGLMDQDLACALLAHQLQAGGIIDPVTGERLELDESIQRNLLSPRMALRVLESLWAFVGMLWPESGELLPITEALQQGVISGDLARKVLNKRHFISAVYSPESGHLIPLGHAEKVLGPEGAIILQQTRIPDILPVTTQTVSLQHRGSCFLSPPSSSATVFSSGGSKPKEQDLSHLLPYLMTHSYINAHSGERLVLMEHELMELINVTGATKDQIRHKVQIKEPSDGGVAGEPTFMRPLSETKHEKNVLIDKKECSTFNTSRVDEQEKDILQVFLEEPGEDVTDIWEAAPKKAVPTYIGSLEEASINRTVEKHLGLMEPGSWLEVKTDSLASDEGMLDENKVKNLLDMERKDASVKTTTMNPDEPLANAKEDLQVRNTGVLDANEEITDTKSNRKKSALSEMKRTPVDVPEKAELDHIPVHQLLQTQEDSGGIINISTREKLPHLNANDKSLVLKDVAMAVAEKQCLDDELISPVSGHRVSSLEKDVQDKPVSEQMATELSDTFRLGQDSPTVMSCENLKVSKARFADMKEPQPFSVDYNKDKLGADTDEQPQAHQPYPASEVVKQKHGDVVSSGDEKDADVSLEVLTQFALNAERRLQEAIEECSPKQNNAVKSHQQSSQISTIKFEDGKSCDIIPQTTKPDNQIQPGKILKNYEKSNVSIVEEITPIMHYGQAQSDKEITSNTNATELPSESDRKESTDNKNDLPKTPVTEGQKIRGKKKGKGKNKNQTKICTESDEKSEVGIIKASQLQDAADKNGNVCSEQKSGEPSVKQEKQVELEFEIGRNPVVHASSDTTADEFGSKVLDIDQKPVNVNLNLKDDSVVTPTEEAKGSHMIKVSIVQKPQHRLESFDVNAASPICETKTNTVTAAFSLDQKSLKAVQELTETKAVATDEKTESQVDLEVLEARHLDITAPLERLDAVVNDKSEKLRIEEEVKVDLELIKPSDIKETEDAGKVCNALDQRHVKDVKECQDVKVHSEVPKPPCESLTSSMESTENQFRKEDGVTDQKAEHVEVIKAEALTGVSVEEAIEGSLGTEIAVSQQKPVVDVKEQKAVRKSIGMDVTLSKDMKPEFGKELSTADQNSVEDKLIREAKVELKVITDVADDKHGEDAGDEKHVDKQSNNKIALESGKKSCTSIDLTTESTENNRNGIVTDQKDENLGDLDVIEASGRTEGLPAKDTENKLTKEFVDQKSIDGDMQIKGLVQTEMSKVSDISDVFEYIVESPPQEREDIRSVHVMQQRQTMENENLVTETSKNAPASLVDVNRDTKDEMESQMQPIVTNDMSKIQADNEIDFNKDYAPDEAEKKRKKKRKAKKRMMEKIGKESEESNADKLVQIPPVDNQPQSDQFSAVEKVEMEQPQKSTQLEKEALLMKAKESILRKVFERGVSEKQAAEELEALRQGSTKEQHTTAQEKAKLDERSVSLPADENRTVKYQATQTDRNINLSANILPKSDSIQLHFSQTDLTDDNFYEKQDLSRTVSSDVSMDTSKQISKPIIILDKAETTVKEHSHLKSENLSETAVPKEPYTSPTGENKDHQKSRQKPQNSFSALEQSEINLLEETSKPELEDIVSKEPMQATTTEYSSNDDEFKDESSLEESSEARLSYLEEVPESDTTECWDEEDLEECQDDVDKKQAEDLVKKPRTAAQISKSSLVRQECLEHDQQIVALLSMVRHTEVRLKQQQQQFMGKSLASLDDIIKQTEALALELTDMEPQVNGEVEAAKQLLKSHTEDVPPQLFTALEKDQQSLSRTFTAAKNLAESSLQGMRSHRDAQKEAVGSELESLTVRVDGLHAWLKDKEAQVEQDADSSEDGAIKENNRETLVKLTQKLQQVKDLQNCLTSRSSDVNAVAFDIQVFISERAQDLAPEQSRRLLRQLQQLQNAFHQASGRTHARAETLSVQKVREEEREQKEQEREQEEREKEKERQTAREREVVQQQKAESSQKLEGLSMWLAGAASLMAIQRPGAESDDVNVLQQKHSQLKEVQKDLQTKADGMMETIRSVEEFLAERGEDLSPEERAKLQAALTHIKEQYNVLTDTAQSSLTQLDSTINTTLQQNTQRAKAEEQLQETQGKIEVLLKELSSLDTSRRESLGETVPDGSMPVGSLNLHNDMLKAELQQLQAQQAHLLQLAQSTHSLLEQPDSNVSPEEKQRLRDRLDHLQSQHKERLQSCQERLRRTEALQENLSKFMEEHGNLGTWLEQSERQLCSLREGETDAQGLKDKLEEHKKLADDVICHKADLRFVSISGQKVLDSIQGSQESGIAIDPVLQDTRQLVSDKLQDATQRYSSLQNKSGNLGTHLSTLLDQYQQYQDEATALDTWLTAQEQNQSILKPSGEQTDTQTLQNTLNTVQHMQDELAERSVQLEKVKRAGKVLTSNQETPKLKTADINTTTDKIERRFDTLTECVSQRAKQLQTAAAQSVSVQEGLKALVSWLDGLALDPEPVQPTTQAVQEALAQNQKLRQELLSRQGSVEATRDSVSKLLKSADALTVSGLQGALQDLNQRYTAAQTKQTENEAELRAVLPKLESFERLNSDLHNFVQSRERVLSLGGLPDRSVEDYKHSIQEVQSDLGQETSHLKTFVELGTDLSKSKLFVNAHSLVESSKEVSDEFARLEASLNERLNAIQSCDQQLVQFRSHSDSILRWLQMAQEQLPAKEPQQSTDSLHRRVQQLKDLLSEWESRGNQIQELNKNSSELESRIISITAPQSKTSAPMLNGAGGSSSLNGIHTCRDLTEIQVVVADVNSRYEQLGGDLRNRQSKQQAMLELCQKARQDSEALHQWLALREQRLAQGQSASPSRPDVARAQAQENKALLSELTEHSGKVEDLKNTLKQLIQENPDSPEAESWKQQLKDLDIRWEKASQVAAQRQAELETCADRLGNFASAANQLGPWLREKELMMSVLGPLSIDPNMLNTQKQQVQFMLREFETRHAQFDQLTQAAEGILSPVEEQGSGDNQDVAEVKKELASITQQWEDLTSRLSGRFDQIERAQGTSESFQSLLKELSQSLSQLAEKLDAQASLSAQPEALRHRLKETGEIRAELEQRKGQLAQAEQLCEDLSAIVVEPYLREELHKRLESVSGPLNNLEERAADGLSQLQAALSSTQQFQQMFEELRSWLDGQAAAPSMPDPLPCQPEALQVLVAQQEELQRCVAQQRGSYDLLQAEGASILASLPAGDERSALQAQLTKLRQDWEEVNQRLTEKQAHIKETLGRAVLFRQHRDELDPWLKKCEQKEAEIQPSLEPAALEEALQKAKQLGLDLDRRRPLLEILNSAADQLLEQSRTGEEEVRDEKAKLNRRLDGLSERLHGRMAQLEELNSRLKEFEDGRLAVERRLEAARHQLEVQEALGPQACSNKSLERLRSQQDTLGSLQPQVVYLHNLAKGLAQDAPQMTGGSGDGGQKLLQQAQTTEKEFGEVTEKIQQCCSSLESRLQGVGEVQSHVRDIFSRLADLDDELDSLSPVGRDVDSLASQADAIRGFLGRLASLRAELEGHGSACTTMLKREGSSPDLLAIRRETEALNRQAAKLAERGQGRLALIEEAEGRVKEFYARLMELQGLLDQAEEGLNVQSVVGTEVDVIKRQLQEFKPPSGLLSQHVSLQEEGLSMTVTPAALLRGLLAFILLPPQLIDDDPLTFSLACTCIYSASDVVSFPLQILLMSLWKNQVW